MLLPGALLVQAITFIFMEEVNGQNKLLEAGLVVLEEDARPGQDAKAAEAGESPTKSYHR